MAPLSVESANLSSKFMSRSVAACTIDFQTETSHVAVGSHACSSNSKIQSAFHAAPSSPFENGTSPSIDDLPALLIISEAVASDPSQNGINFLRKEMAGGEVGTSSKVIGHCAMADKEFDG